MSVVRRFLIAPSLVRLIRKERGGSRVTEGYFAPQAGRTSFVRVEGSDCHLVLVTADAEGRAKEERTEVPRAHGDALLDVCSGKAAYERTNVPVGGRDVVIDRYVTPSGLDIVSVAFDDAGTAQGFAPPAWFGNEVTSDAAYERHAVAIAGAPATGEIGLSNAALDAVLDLIEPRFGFGSVRRPLGADARSPSPEAPPPAPPPKPVAVSEPTPAPAVTAPPEPIKPPADPTPANESAPPASEEPRPAETLVSTPEAEPSEPIAADSKPEAKQPEEKVDARIDDVIESLSAALSAAIQQPRETSQEESSGAQFERWSVRPRRTNQ